MTCHPPRRLRLANAAALAALSLPSIAGAAPARADSRGQQPAGRQDAVVEGVVLHPDGSPADGVPVEVVGYDDAGFGGAIVAIFSLGIACVADSASCVGTATEGGGAKTAADGTYRGSLPDSYVSGTETVVHAFAVAHADVRVPHAHGRTIYHQDLFTATVALPPVVLVPPSRGAPCTMMDNAGRPVPHDPENPCPMTDGNRVSRLPEGVRSVVVELPAVTDVADVFVIGCSQGCAVEASADGTTWSVLANDPTIAETYGVPSDDLLVASADAPQAARFVRVTRPDGVYALSEISVWSGVPSQPPARGRRSGSADDKPGSAISPAIESSDDRGDAATVVAISLAALALMGASVAVGVAWARRPA